MPPALLFVTVAGVGGWLFQEAVCGPLAGIETPNGGAVEVATVKRGAMLRAGLGVGVGFDAAQAERLPADNADSLMRHKAPLLVGRVGGLLDAHITI